MVEATLGRSVEERRSSTGAQLTRAFRFMLLARVLDDKLASLYRAGKIHGGVFLGRGQEALSAAVGMQLRKGDVFAPLVRDTAGRLAFGEPVQDAVRTYFGSALGPMRGRDGNVHRGSPVNGILPMISHLGAMISVVNGILYARRFRGQQQMVGVTCIGDGGTSTGAFHEGVNQAAVERLPLVIVVANNQFAYSTPNKHQFACKSLVDKAVGYGVRACQVDGTDLEACLSAAVEAVGRARSGEGPQMIVAELLRLCGHGEHDDAAYISPSLKQSPVGRDCIKVAEALLLRQGLVTQETLAAWRREAANQVEQTVAATQREPAPDPYREDWSAISSKHLTETHTEPEPTDDHSSE